MNYRAAIVTYLPMPDRDRLASILCAARALPSVRFYVVICASGSSSTSGLDAKLLAHSNISTVEIPMDLGKGAAWRAAMAKGSEEVVAFWNLDACVEPAELERLLDILYSQPQLDVVLGTRRGVRAFGGLGRFIFSRSFSFLANSLFRLRISDVQAPVKVLRRALLDQLFEQLRLANRGFDTELLFYCRKRGARIRQERMTWTAGPRTWSYLRAGLETLVGLVGLRLLTSPVARLPLVSLIGRRYAIPAKREYSILIFAWRDPKNPLSGGGEVYLREQAREWVRAGHKITWFAQRFKGSATHEVIEGVTVVRRGTVPWCFIAGGLWYIFKSGRSFDFIIDCMNGIPFFSPLFSTKPKVCLVYHIHTKHFREELPRVLGSIACWVEQRLVPWVYARTRFMTISESTRDELLALKMTRHEVTLVHSGVPIYYRPGPKAEEPTVLYVGRLKGYKRVRNLISAFGKIKQVLPSAQLIIAGDGEDKEALREFCLCEGVPDVTFAGFVSDEEKVSLMQRAWVFGMPSSLEGWGIVVIEANACGTPAVGYRVPGVRDCIADGRTGILADDDEAFAASLSLVLSDSELRQRLSSGALQWAARFSWREAAARTLQEIRMAQPWHAVFEPEESRWALKCGAPVEVEKSRPEMSAPR